MIRTTIRWLANTAKVGKGTGPTHPKIKRGNHYVRMLRNLTDCGFRLATQQMADAYFALVNYQPDPADAHYLLSDWREQLEERTYCSSLCQMVELRPGYYGYATHARSEEMEVAIDNCAEYFQHFEKPVWVMPIPDNEEMISMTFEFLVGDEEEVLGILAEAARG